MSRSTISTNQIFEMLPDTEAIILLLGDMYYTHERIDHGAKEYVRASVTTNGSESVWAVMKRGLHGVYHHASTKHLHRYVHEFTFRLNDCDVKRHTLERFTSLMLVSFGPRRSTYKELTA